MAQYFIDCWDDGFLVRRYFATREGAEVFLAFYPIEEGGLLLAMDEVGSNWPPKEAGENDEERNVMRSIVAWRMQDEP